jgi:hypothetical protein
LFEWTVLAHSAVVDWIALVRTKPSVGWIAVCPIRRNADLPIAEPSQIRTKKIVRAPMIIGKRRHS